MPRYQEQAQKLILNVAQFFENERTRLQRGENIVSPNNITFRASLALGVSENTIMKLKKHGIQKDDDYVNNMSQKMKGAKTQITNSLKSSIREIIYKMYDINEYVTIQSLHMRLLEEYTTEDFPYSHSSVYKWCKEIGFKWKTSSERKYLMEQPDIRLKRTKFLREYNKNKTLPSPLKPVFLDETWIFSKGAHRKSWQDETLATSSKKCGEGFRYIVVHAGFCTKCCFSFQKPC
jgi:transposase